MVMMMPFFSFSGCNGGGGGQPMNEVFLSSSGLFNGHSLLHGILLVYTEKKKKNSELNID